MPRTQTRSRPRKLHCYCTNPVISAWKPPWRGTGLSRRWFTPIPASPPSILLAQKMITVLLRKREKGRDLFDVSFLRGLAQPDYDYIEKVLGLGEQEFRRQFDARVRELDLEFLARDVEPFLFSPDQKKRILHFHE